MPIVLIIAFAASVSLHVAALFGPDIDLATEPESVPLVAVLRPLPKPLPLTKSPFGSVEPPEKVTQAKNNPLRQKKTAVTRSTPMMTTPELSHNAIPVGAPESELVSEPVTLQSASGLVSIAAKPRLPPHGMIRYRVDRGDSNFEIGFARQEWDIFDERYRLISVVETTGLAWLFKSVRIEMESIGRMTSEGLQPELFFIKRNGQETGEKAVFDWESMKIRVGGRAEQVLTNGAQDLLSFNYQLGYLPHPESGSALPITTGKKYGHYRLEVLGDEDIEVPAGVFHTLHLRAPGVNTTELWLAYDYLLLPVKIRHVDSKGDSFVQVATEIQLGIEQATDLR